MKYSTPEAFAAKLMPGEPYFCLRARDVLAMPALLLYASSLAAAELRTQSQEVQAIAVSFAEWQKANPDLVHLPD